MITRFASLADMPEIGDTCQGRLEGKASPRETHSCISVSISRPAFNAAASGANGDKPAAIKSALMKRGHCASAGRNDLAKVVFPAPLGPAMIIYLLAHILFGAYRLLSCGGSRASCPLLRFILTLAKAAAPRSVRSSLT